MKEGDLKAERHDLAREEDGKDITPGKRPTEAMTRKQGWDWQTWGALGPAAMKLGSLLTWCQRKREGPQGQHSLHNSEREDIPQKPARSHTRQGEFSEQGGWEEVLSVIYNSVWP